MSTSNETTMLRLRRAVGLIGFGLPVVLLVGVALFGVPMQPSISEFFFTGLREVFVGAIAGVGLFLLAYEGYPKKPGEILTDRGVSAVAGVSVLIVGFVPTLCATPGCYQPPALFDRLFPEALGTWQAGLHFFAAGLFLFCLGVMAIRLFTRSDSPAPETHKRRRNACYVGLGWTIIATVAVLAIVKLGFPTLAHAWDAGWNFTFWAESLALWAFALSWLLKGEMLAGRLPFLFRADELTR